MKADGTLLWRRRIELGMTLRAVSAETGVDYANLSKLERNQVGAHLGTLKTLADFYNLPMKQVVIDLRDASAAA